MTFWRLMTDIRAEEIREISSSKISLAIIIYEY
jgi:hypothetical protein